jgi:hypothetical protein
MLNVEIELEELVLLETDDFLIIAKYDDGCEKTVTILARHKRRDRITEFLEISERGKIAVKSGLMERVAQRFMCGSQSEE